MLVKLRRGECAAFTHCASANGCVPGTAHVLKGEPTIFNYGSQGKSQAQPDGGEGHRVITTGCPVTVPRKAVAPLRRSNTKARGDEQKSSQAFAEPVPLRV